MSKVIKKIVAAVLIIVVILGIAAGAVYLIFTLSAPTLTLSGESAQTIEGFGVTGAWWAQGLTDPAYRTRVINALFTEEGLGLNIYRYNVGAGEADNPEGRVDSNRATQSFYYFNPETGEYEYDFSRDHTAYQVLLEALRPGHTVDSVIMFANSPHYSMTVSGSATGQNETHKLNLREDAFYDYADYLVTIAEHFLSEGIPVTYISPINEPQWSWGGPDAVQEGCHYEPEDVATLAEVLYYRMLDSSLPENGVGMSLFESGSVKVADFEPYLKALQAKPDVMAAIDHLSVHSYHLDYKISPRVRGLELVEQYAPGKKIHLTEWCELPCTHPTTDIGGAILTAKTISDDFNYLNAVSWQSWKAYEDIYDPSMVDTYSDALLYGDMETGELYYAKRYFALKHYSYFVKPGSVRLEAGTSFAAPLEKLRENYLPITAFETPEGKTVVVITNTTGVERVLKSGEFAGRNALVYRTDQKRNMELIESGSTSDKLSLPAESITTFVFD